MEEETEEEEEEEEEEEDRFSILGGASLSHPPSLSLSAPLSCRSYAPFFLRVRLASPSRWLLRPSVRLPSAIGCARTKTEVMHAGLGGRGGGGYRFLESWRV